MIILFVSNPKILQSAVLGICDQQNKAPVLKTPRKATTNNNRQVLTKERHLIYPYFSGTGNKTFPLHTQNLHFNISVLSSVGLFALYSQLGFPRQGY